MTNIKLCLLEDNSNLHRINPKKNPNNTHRPNPNTEYKLADNP